MSFSPPLPSGLRTRIAPTPSGLLHAGNGAAFVLTHRLTQEAGGTLQLRIDDLDAERMREAYLTDIFTTLEWLGIRWTEGPRDPADHHRNSAQELKLPRYLALVDQLRAAGVLYACTCSRRTVAMCRCRDAAHSFEGSDRAWRLRLPEGMMVGIPSWPGPMRTVDLAAAMPDPVVRQRNGRPAYQIASLADDVDNGITFIVRGEDLLPSTACQLHLARSLGFSAFQRTTFVHHGLLTGPDGQKLSKSQGAGSLKAFREAGGDPAVIWAQAETLLSALS